MPTRKQLANALRVLAMDAVEAAKSGHPGAPMGMADMAEALWRGAMRHNPANPAWSNRDRFVLSNGHASALIYGLLHLTGYELGMDDLRNFRQLHSKTPGHPEVHETPGVEITTGPLGQGLASAVGMALAEKLLAQQFNRPGYDIVDHYTYVFAGDGCMMEGVSQEACSFAGTFGLGKLIVLYDSNGISIDGKVDGWFADDTAARFEACGWHVVRDVDGHDSEALDAAIAAARADTTRPSLLCCRTVIGFGSPGKAGTSASHGSPLGRDEILATRAALGWEGDAFSIAHEVYQAWNAKSRGAADEAEWTKLFDAYRAAFPDLATEFERRMRGELPAAWAATIAKTVADMAATDKPRATRQASGDVLSVIAGALPELFGGSADLTGSVNTKHPGSVPIDRDHLDGNYLSYGVREFLMACMMNGMALHGGFVPYGGTFLVFSDYMRNAIRLSALMRQRVIYVLTHDSIGVGEDGPTHQPVEQTPSLRLIPGLQVWRPCDMAETAVAWKAAVEYAGPSALVLTRQALPQQPRSAAMLADVSRGGYIVRPCVGEPDAILIATGSEVQLAMQAAGRLEAEGMAVQVVSMPCAEVFDAQDEAWKEMVLPRAVRRRVAIEAAAVDGWYKYVGLDGAVIGMTGFGASGPGDTLFDHFGFTVDAVVSAVRGL